MTNGLTVENWKLRLFRHPNEDAYSIDREEGLVAVADGVTRDPISYLPKNNLLGKVKFLRNYPNPSPAKIASDIFVATFPLVLKDFNAQNRDDRAIREGFKITNEKIREWNDNNIPNPDYVLNDFAGCVASGTSHQYGVVHWGYLTDTGIAIFDEKGNLRFRTENQGPDKYDKYIWADKRLKTIDWKNPEARRIVRRDYRNNPQEKHSFGVLTGEESAMKYVRTGKEELRPGEHLIVYTDGLESTIFSSEFSDALRGGHRAIKKLCQRNVRTEGTLIHDYQSLGTNSLSAYEREWQMEQIARDNLW